MELINFKSYLIKLLEDDIDIKLNDISVDDVEILNNEILNEKRLVIPYISNIYFRISINDPSQDFISFNLCEFNRCCGKLILHTIRYSNGYNDYKNKMIYKDINDEKFREVIDKLLKSLQSILKSKKYSSLSFIVSEIEQTKLYNILSELNYKPVNSFNNQRMPLKNKCHEYVINLEV